MVQGTKLSYAETLRRAAQLYVQKVTGQPLYTAKKKYSKAFWSVRSFLYKQDPDAVTRVYEYLLSKDSFEYMTVYDLLKRAKQYQTELRWKEVQPIGETISPYSFTEVLTL